MAERALFKPGDVVVHSRRREWGDGVVEKAATVEQDGKAGQRLTVTFRHHGRVTINTNVAMLVAKEKNQDMSTTNATKLADEAPRGGWLDSLNGDRAQAALWSLPEVMTDPFTSLRQRLVATLDSYRFSKEARSLIEWSIAQTGLEDPLTRFTRHELEEGFDRFARDRVVHLNDLVRTIKRQGQGAMLDDVLNQCRYPRGIESLQAAMRR
jgi:hypothetical protein